MFGSDDTQDNNLTNQLSSTPVVNTTLPSDNNQPVTDPVDTTTPALPSLSTDEKTEDTIQPALPAVPDMPDNDLLDLKHKALHELSPIIGQLDLEPEEKFKTIMMLIQSSDDQSLLVAAYESAQAISNEKARAQALLDLVNEINYFTQPKVG